MSYGVDVRIPWEEMMNVASSACVLMFYAVGVFPKSSGLWPNVFSVDAVVITVIVPNMKPASFNAWVAVKDADVGVVFGLGGGAVTIISEDVIGRVISAVCYAGDGG